MSAFVNAGDCFWSVLAKLKRLGPAPNRAFWSVGDAAWRGWVLHNAVQICRDGVPTADGEVIKLSAGAREVFMLIVEVRLGFMDFYGHLSTATIAQRLEASPRKVDYALAELETLELIERIRERREVVGIDLAKELFRFERPRRRALPPAGNSGPTYPPTYPQKKDSAEERPLTDPSRKNLRAPIYISRTDLDDTPLTPRSAFSDPAAGPPEPPNGNGRKETPRPTASAEMTDTTATAERRPASAAEPTLTKRIVGFLAAACRPPQTAINERTATAQGIQQRHQPPASRWSG